MRGGSSSSRANAAPTAASLGAAVEKSAATLRELMAVLVPAWRWPNV
jgi:hypothetical protein